MWPWEVIFKNEVGNILLTGVSAPDAEVAVKKAYGEILDCVVRDFPNNMDVNFSDSFELVKLERLEHV
jgi:hypothetical protein